MPSAAKSVAIAKWRDAHHEITFSDDGLATMAPFPSLSMQDFINYLEARGEADDVISFLTDLMREVRWVYDCWTKEQRDRDGVRLMDDLMRNVPKQSDHADFIFRFIRDYRAANNLNWQRPDDQRAWEQAMAEKPEEVVGL